MSIFQTIMNIFKPKIQTTTPQVASNVIQSMSEIPVSKPTNISSQGLQLIEYYEGLRLTAYLDTSNVPTIGYGHTSGVKIGETITLSQAADFLVSDVQTACNCVINNVTATLTQYEFDALVSFVFNIGSGNFLSSTAFKDLNKSYFSKIPADLALWNRSGGKVSDGLVNRRNSEGILFATGNLSLAPIASPDNNQG